jgi:hypothetical protein
MTDQLWALIAFAALMTALVWAMAIPTRARKLDGRQKYRARTAPLLNEDGSHRPGMSGVTVALAALCGGSRSTSGDSDGHDTDSGGFDSGDGGAGDGGGDGGGD